MTIEEKAKRYDEAIRKAKDMLSYKEVRQEDMEYLFPELKESEDERIRKALIDIVNARCELYKGITKEMFLAWLEKQKAIDVLDEEEREFADNVDSYRKEIDAAYQKGYNEGVKATLEKQGEPLKNDE